MTDSDIREVLVRATSDLAPPADLLARVRNGGRRRVVRRRAVLAAGVAGLAAVPFAVWRGTSAVEPEPPAAGDLGQDQAFLGRARDAWDGVAGMFGTEGRARVRWAGNTPAGPAALLSQPVRFDGGERQDLLGWVETAGGELRAVGSGQLVARGAVEPSALLLGRLRDVLVVADLGQPVELSEDFSFDAVGQLLRTWQPVVSDGGVSVRRVFPQLGRVGIAMRYGTKRVEIANLGEMQPATTSQVPQRIDRVLAGATALGGWDVTALAKYADTYGYQLNPDLTSWHVRGTLPDGRALVVQTVPGDDGARVFFFVGSGTPRYAGFVRPPGLLLHVRLAFPQGVVVGYLNATFRYRAAGGPWLPVTGDVVLLPAVADEVEVTPRGGQPFVTVV
ncbi:hypothetical protein [Actinoplanes sp. NPDC026619]|uniref:hypothetical protein n=1 Tax=Actinoplanes sp. NPDC026619 TaxID=3155798 RepID=UPI0033D4F5C1